MVNSLTFPRLVLNSLTFPGFPNKWSPYKKTICACKVIAQWFFGYALQHMAPECFDHWAVPSKTW